MIINDLMGGLGNQLFQISAGFAHAKNIKTDYAINYKIGSKYNGQGHPHMRYKDNLIDHQHFHRYAVRNNLLFLSKRSDSMLMFTYTFMYSHYEVYRSSYGLHLGLYAKTCHLPMCGVFLTTADLQNQYLLFILSGLIGIGR